MEDPSRGSSQLSRISTPTTLLHTPASPSSRAILSEFQGAFHSMSDSVPATQDIGDAPDDVVRVDNGQCFDAIKAASGNLSQAARSLGLTRTSLKNRVDRVPELAHLVIDLRDEVVDTAEQNHFIRAKSGEDPAAERFILSTLGADRGYRPSVGGSGKDGEIVVVLRKDIGGSVEGD